MTFMLRPYRLGEMLLTADGTGQRFLGPPIMNQTPLIPGRTCPANAMCLPFPTGTVPVINPAAVPTTDGTTPVSAPVTVVVTPTSGPIPPPSAVPVAAASANWFVQSMFGGIPNWMLAGGAALLFFGLGGHHK